MDLQADIKWIHKELDKVNDPSLIEVLKNMLKSKSLVKTERISKGQYNNEMDISISEIDSGDYHNHEDVKRMIKKWGEK